MSLQLRDLQVVIASKNILPIFFIGILLGQALSAQEAVTEITPNPPSNAVGSNTLSSEPMKFSFRPTSRSHYQDAVLRLSLDKTRIDYGDYTISPINRISLSRATYTYANLITVLSYSKTPRISGEQIYIPIPIDFGLTGYRICMANSANKKRISKVSSLESLKEFSIVQGTNWPDVRPLKANGFRVLETLDLKNENLLKMTAAGRADIYCQSLSQYLEDYQEYKGNLDIEIVESFALYYPMPRFFYLNADKTKEAKRIELGLQRSIADGSLKQLWLSYFKVAFETAHLEQRHIFKLHNPDVDELNNSYEAYFIDPLDLTTAPSNSDHR